MATIKFHSVDLEARTATFDVDGELVTRGIPAVLPGTLEEYLEALARGLMVEVLASVETELSEPNIEQGEVLVSAD